MTLRTRITIAAVAAAGMLAAAITPGSAVAAGDGSQQSSCPTLRECILQAPGLSDSERTLMLANLDAMLSMGVQPASVEAVFPGGGREVPTRELLRLQRIVMDTVRDGLPVDLILAKTREGRIKGVADPQLVQASERMAGNVRSARRILETAVRPGVDTFSRAEQDHMMDEVSLQLWRGLTEEGYVSLCRAADGRPAGEACDAGDLVAAGEVAVRLLETGVDSDRALKFAREAIRRGYRVREMRQIQLMVVASHKHGQGPDEFMQSMEYCVNVDMRPVEMYDYLMRQGWMGPGEMHRPGGRGMPPAERKGHGGSGNMEIERGDRQGGGGRDR
jgi:hypothetical protein